MVNTTAIFTQKGVMGWCSCLPNSSSHRIRHRSKLLWLCHAAIPCVRPCHGLYFQRKEKGMVQLPCDDLAKTWLLAFLWGKLSHMELTISKESGKVVQPFDQRKAGIWVNIQPSFQLHHLVCFIDGFVNNKEASEKTFMICG